MPIGRIVLSISRGVACCGILLLFACATVDSTPAPEEEKDLVGFSGKIDPEAEKLFGQARILWRSSQAAGVAMVESCSNPVKAIELLERAVAIEPEYAEAYIRLGLAKSEIGKKEEAFEDATKAIRIEPRSAWYAYRGLISLRAGALAPAMKDLDYSLQLNSSQYLAWNIRGAVFMAADDDEAACDDFKTACSNGDCSHWDIALKEGICR